MWDQGYKVITRWRLWQLEGLGSLAHASLTRKTPSHLTLIITAPEEAAHKAALVA